MKILNDLHIKQLKENGSEHNREKDHYPVVKLFLPGTNCTWLLTELDPESPDTAFGLCDLGMGFPELGYLSLEELTNVRLHGFLTVQCDQHFTAKYPLSIYARAARMVQAVTEDEDILKQASAG